MITANLSLTALLIAYDYYFDYYMRYYSRKCGMSEISFIYYDRNYLLGYRIFTKFCSFQLNLRAKYILSLHSPPLIWIHRKKNAEMTIWLLSVEIFGKMKINSASTDRKINFDRTSGSFWSFFHSCLEFSGRNSVILFYENTCYNLSWKLLKNWFPQSLN